MITFEKAHLVICDFVSKYSTDHLVEVLEFIMDSSDQYKIIRVIVSSEFKISLKVLNSGGNDKAIYRNLCYYLHSKYDPSYSIAKMVRLYGKQPNSIRNGITNIENILEQPRIAKDIYHNIINAEAKLKEILEWENLRESELEKQTE